MQANMKNLILWGKPSNNVSLSACANGTEKSFVYAQDVNSMNIDVKLKTMQEIVDYTQSALNINKDFTIEVKCGKIVMKVN